jgi:Arc/MetJ-type ribon-helix-helix transcriptional regulator
MTVNISAQNEIILENAVNSGRFKDKQEAVSEAIRLLAEKTNEEIGESLIGTAWQERLHRHLKSTPGTSAATVDDSRESIYEGRGL